MRADRCAALSPTVTICTSYWLLVAAFCTSCKYENPYHKPHGSPQCQSLYLDDIPAPTLALVPENALAIISPVVEALASYKVQSRPISQTVREADNLHITDPRMTDVMEVWMIYWTTTWRFLRLAVARRHSVSGHRVRQRSCLAQPHRILFPVSSSALGSDRGQFTN